NRGGSDFSRCALPRRRRSDLSRQHIRRFDAPAGRPLVDGSVEAALRRATERALTQFHVDAAVLDQAMATVGDEEAALEERIWDALREAARGGLDTLAQRIDSETTFD